MSARSQLVQALISGDQLQYRNSHRQLLLLGAAAVPDLLAALRLATAERDQWRILVTLADIGGPETVPTMISFLKSHSSAIRALAAQFLGKAGDARAVEPMITLVDAADSEFATTWVIQALGLLGDRRAVDPLLHLLARTESPTERYMSIEALGLLGDPKAEPDIRTYTCDADHHVRDRAAIALRRLGGDPL